MHIRTERTSWKEQCEKQAGRLHIDRMITHRPAFTAEGITDIFREIEKGNVIKAVFDPWKL